MVCVCVEAQTEIRGQTLASFGIRFPCPHCHVECWVLCWPIGRAAGTNTWLGMRDACGAVLAGWGDGRGAMLDHVRVARVR